MSTMSELQNDCSAFDATAVRAMLDSVRDVVLLVREDGMPLYGNAAATELDAWLRSGAAAAGLAAQVPRLVAAARAATPQRATVALRGAHAQLRDYRVVCAALPRPCTCAAPFTSQVLALHAVSGAASAAAELAHARLEDSRRQLLQADRMASIGQLAAGVAHEINNPIGYVQSNLGTMAGYVTGMLRLIGAQQATLRRLAAAQHSDALRDIEKIREQIDFEFLAKDLPLLLSESQAGIGRVRNIVHDLRDFSRAAHAEQWRLADIHAGLDSTLNIVWNDLKYKVELVKRYGDIPRITCLPAQLNQVFMNILVNAGHAIEGRGQIVISTRADADMVYVEISDTGKGMAAHVLANIFDPFYTTKPAGEGTGLGLSISAGIVARHGGRIDVRSAVGRGTSMTIALPIRPPAAPDADADAPPASPAAVRKRGAVPQPDRNDVSCYGATAPRS